MNSSTLAVNLAVRNAREADICALGEPVSQTGCVGPGSHPYPSGLDFHSPLVAMARNPFCSAPSARCTPPYTSRALGPTTTRSAPGGFEEHRQIFAAVVT